MKLNLIEVCSVVHETKQGYPSQSNQWNALLYHCMRSINFCELWRKPRI